MISVQLAETADKEQIRALWSVCFGDSGPFMDWFFAHRFVPGFAACVKDGPRLVGAMQSYPLHVRIRGASIPCAIIAGVSIHPDYRGRGLMGKMLAFYMNEMRKKGIVVCPHTPARLPTFFALGHYPVTDAAYGVLQGGGEDASPFVSELSLPREAGALLPCYSFFARGYSGIIDRSMADFQLKMDDYASDGARCLAWKEAGAVMGYVVYYTPHDILAEECVALRPRVLEGLLSHLARLFPGKKISAKLSPSMPLSLPGFSATVRPKGVMGAANIQELLRLAAPKEKDCPSFAMEVEDPVVPGNRGLFTLSGEIAKEAPRIRLPAGRLTQLICGYASLDELIQQEAVTLFDRAAAAELNRLLPKMPCFIVDEY